MFKKAMKKVTGVALAVTMVLSPLANSLSVQADNEEKLILHYYFQDLEGQVVNDASGNGKTGVTQPLGAPKSITQVNINGELMNAFSFKGGQPGSTNPYISILYTADAADEEDSVTLGGSRSAEKKN